VRVAGTSFVDTAAVRRAAQSVVDLAPRLFTAGTAVVDDGVGRWARRQLACPAALLAELGVPDPAPQAVAARRVEGACQAR
jgi:hypothetical protein